MSSFSLNSSKALQMHYARASGKARFCGAGARAFVFWQKSARLKLVQLLGLDRFKKCPAKPRKIKTTRLGSITCEDWIIQTEQYVWMPFYLLIPDHSGVRMPLAVCAPGHGITRKHTAGLCPKDPVTLAFRCDYGLQLAKRGFITACIDSRGFGERMEVASKASPEKDCSCDELTLAGVPLGMTVQGMWVWDLMRLVDFLILDKRIDRTRISCVGLSAGGLQSLSLAAIDCRIRAAVVSGYFFGVREAFQSTGHCMGNMVPHLWEDFDMGDIASLVAPRTLFIETGARDPLNGKSGLLNVTRQVKIARQGYRTAGASKFLQHYIFNGAHRWDGAQTLERLEKLFVNHG